MDVTIPQLLLRRYEAARGLVDPGSKVVPPERLLALREAAAIIEAATSRAEAIVGSAEAAHEAERQKGYARGLEEAQREQTLRVLENVARHVDFLERSEDRIVDLVMQAVRRVIDGFDERERAVAAVRSVLAIARDQKQVTLRLSPEHAETVRRQIQDMVAAYPAIGFIDVVPEQRIEGDACVLESDMGVIESSIRIQLAAIQSAFDRALGRSV